MESILVLVSFLAVGTVGIFVMDGLDSFLKEVEHEREKKEPERKGERYWNRHVEIRNSCFRR